MVTGKLKKNIKYNYELQLIKKSSSIYEIRLNENSSFK